MPVKTTLLHPGPFYMWHKLCDASVDQINNANKISHRHEDSKQEPESSGRKSSLNDLSSRDEEPLLTERFGPQKRSVLLTERLNYHFSAIVKAART